MSQIFEGRTSDSPYIEMIWRGRVVADCSPVCPADVRWNLLFTKFNGQVRVTVEGPTTSFVPKTQYEGAEFLVIKFKLGTFIPYLPASKLVDTDASLPTAAAGKSFSLNSTTWQLPDFENIETFVDQLAQQDLLMRDPVVSAMLHTEYDQAPALPLSSRTVRRRFLYSTGLTYKSIQQIERAKRAASLLEQGVPILDTVYQLGYADQPHLTRSLRRFIGNTPAQIVRASTLQQLFATLNHRAP